LATSVGVKVLSLMVKKGLFFAVFVMACDHGGLCTAKSSQRELPFLAHACIVF
jgi:hypothetical protein